MTPRPGADVRRAADRFRTRTDWLDSRHSFSYGPHYDPDNTHFGVLLVHNEDVVRAGAGFESHPHRDMEIVTWVLAGSLVHEDTAGHAGVIRPGLAQRMSAGSGIRHSETNDAWRLGEPEHADDVHLVQMWVLPDTDGAPPGYDQHDVTAQLAGGGLVVVASGRPEHADDRAVAIRQRAAALHAARLRPGTTVMIPSAPFAHVFVTRGGVSLEGAGPLETGDAARITGGDGRRIAAGPDGAEVLVWEMHASLSVPARGAGTLSDEGP